MTAFIPFRLLLDDLGLWSAEIAELGAAGDASILDELGVRDAGVVETAAGPIARFTLVLDRELAIPLFGLAGCAVVFGGGSSATAQAELTIEVDLAGPGTVRFVDVTAALRFPPTMLRPVVAVDGRFTPDPARPHSEIVFTATVEVGDQSVRLSGAPTLTLAACTVGDSGVVVSAEGIALYLDGATAPAGRPVGWRGVHLPSVRLYLPDELADVVGDLSLTDGHLGNGGFSGTVATEWTPALSARLGGLDLALASVAVGFEQNALVAAAVRGEVTVPFFDEPVDVEIGIGLDGSLLVGLSAENGLHEFTREGLMTVRLDALALVREQDRFGVVLSGELRPLAGGLDWPAFAVRELAIDADGHVRLEGGWLSLPSQFALDFHGFQFEITRLGFGRTPDGGRWVGFSGGLKLIDGMPAGASVEGLRVAWYTDGRPVAITLEGVGVAFAIPGVLEFAGAIAYRELPGPVHRFDGAIRLALTTLGLEVDGRLVVGYDAARDHPFFAVYLGVELPAGIPLWTTGLGLFGFAGLFGANMEPGRLPDEPWYGLAPGEGWYKRDPIGVAELTKWTNREGSVALGGGVTIGTVADNGFTFAGRFLLVIVLPGPVVLLEGKANILAERASLSDDPLLRAIAVLDAREGSFLVGLDAHYAFAADGEVIDIGGGAEVFFALDDPLAWHLYLGQKDPVERRIRATVFRLFEADAYFMLDSRRIQAGAWIGYDEEWRFGPVRVALAAWIAGDAVLNTKPLHFTGELWLHGGLEASVFGFGFGIGADARVTGEVFDPFQIVIELAFHLNLPWPLPDVDVPLTLRWGPTPTPPPLPLPLKEVAVEHLLASTSWPLPRTSIPALLAPNYDPSGDGFLAAPVGSSATVPANAPVVPLDARPRLTFSRTVHDDALVGVNPQPPFPAAQPETGWEWIGDPNRNEGPTRMRTGLEEVALERRTGSGWTTVARKAAAVDPDVPTLFGSWAPVPQLPGGDDPPVGQTALWLWSRSGFDHTRDTTGVWDTWFAGAYPGYPCVDVPDDERICCDVAGLADGAPPPSPWSCPAHPEFQIGWSAAAPPTVAGGALCADEGTTLRLRLGRAVRSVEVLLTVREAQPHCLDLRDRRPGEHPNPWRAAGFAVEAFHHDGAPRPSVEIAGGPVSALYVAWRLTVALPGPATRVELVLVAGASGGTVEAYGPAGRLVDRQPVARTRDRPAVVTVSGRSIETVAVVAPSNETHLLRVCAWPAGGGVQVVPVDRTGRPGRAVPVRDGVATLDGAGVREVEIRGRAAGFCLSGFCVVVGPSDEERATLVAMGQHTRDETARWSGQGHVLQPHSDYRLKIVTTVETRDFPHDPAFNTVRRQTEYAFFRTAGPPGVTALSVPVNAPNPAEFASGLDDLTRYVRQTVPPTVATVAAGGAGTPARPVFRAYDVGVEFAVDHVDLMYRAGGADLGLYVVDNNDRPARDGAGRLLAANRWGVTESLAVTESDLAWIGLVDASACAAIDVAAVVRTRTLATAGHLLDGDTLHEARLVPLLVHDTFTGYPAGAASGTGARLTDPATGLGWRVHDAGTVGDPSRWAVGPGIVEQTSAIRGGSAGTRPGTLLLRADDPSRAATDPAQPAGWTDYRLAAVVTASGGAAGLVVRHTGPDDHYLFAVDRDGGRRRLVRVAGGVWTTLAEDAAVSAAGSEHDVAVEALGDRIAVFVDGAAVFEVRDGTHPRGGVGLYAWSDPGARFADVRVDDLRATAPVVYRFAFTTSRFADFYGQVHSGTGDAWAATAARPPLVAAAVAPATAGPPDEAEARGYAALAGDALGAAAHAGTAAVEATLASTPDGAALLLRTAEPVDWTRTSLAVSRAAGPAVAVAPMPDAVPAAGAVALTGWTPGVAVPDEESVTVLCRAAVDLADHRIEYRTLPSTRPAPAPDGTVLAEPDLSVDGPFTGTVVDTGGGPRPQWRTGGGVLGQHAAISGTGVAVVGDGDWTDVRVRTLLSVAAPGTIGVALRWAGPDDHYLFALDGTAWTLVRRRGGVSTPLRSAPYPLPPGEWHEVVTEAVGTRLRVVVDGEPVADLHDDGPASGAVAMACAATDGARFAGVRVVAAEPVWRPYHTFPGPAGGAGRRLRLFAGAESDAAATAVTGEDRAFQGATVLRLPGEGVDLRLLDPAGVVRHARRFVPDAAFVAEPDVGLLRSADATGLALVRAGGLAPGAYRLAWTFRRDNTAADPSSVVLRRHGDDGPEQVVLDLRVGP